MGKTDPTFLIVDDESLLLDAIGYAIENEGYNVIKANSVDDAIAQLDSNKIDAVLSDIRMPNRSGIELLEYVNSHHKPMSFTFMSGYSELDDASAKKLGARGLVLKPIDLEALRKTLTAALEPA